MGPQSVAPHQYKSVGVSRKFRERRDNERSATNNSGRRDRLADPTLPVMIAFLAPQSAGLCLA
jgi:hypothetical protein